MVGRSEPSALLRAEGRRHTVYYLGLQHKGFQTKWGGRHIIQLRAEPFEACPYQTDLSFDFEREISAFVHDAAKV